MIVVADASPLIFLAKIRQLELIHALLGRDVRLPDAVRRELFAGRTDPVERELLERFLEKCRIETVRRPRRFASAMSTADNAALTLALRSKADFLLCDERVTRSMAEIEGVRPLGTLGVLLRATRKKLISTKESRRLVDLLVGSHDFRIGVAVYQAVMEELTPCGKAR
jgi:predicted nucleic acid-binding protein